MQRQTQECGSPGVGSASMLPDPVSGQAQAAMDAGPNRSAGDTHSSAAALIPFEFVMRAPGDRPIAAGGLFALDAALVPTYANDLVRSAQIVLSKVLGRDLGLPFADCRVETQFKPLPLLNPRPFALDQERIIDAAELIVAGPRFFPTSQQARSERVAAGRQPFLDRVSTSEIAQILTTDPGVRRARAAGEEVSWRLSADCTPEDDGSVRVALHVTAAGKVVSISPVTVVSVLSLTMCMVSYGNHGEGRGWKDTIELAPSASVRAATAASQLTADEQHLEQCSDAIALLDALDLGYLAQSLAGQAGAAVSPRET